MMNLLLDIYLMNANLLKNYQMHGSRKNSKKSQPSLKSDLVIMNQVL